MTDMIRLFTRNLTSTTFDAKTGQIACWICSAVVMVCGTLKLTRLQLTESELFLGILLVLAVSILGILLGLLIPIAEYVAQKQSGK